MSTKNTLRIQCIVLFLFSLFNLKIEHSPPLAICALEVSRGLDEFPACGIALVDVVYVQYVHAGVAELLVEVGKDGVYFGVDVDVPPRPRGRDQEYNIKQERW